MAELLNLRVARKRAKRTQDEQAAQANRLVHGTPTRIRKLKTEQQAKTERDLDSHRIDRGDGR